jgi:hypothetical protein
MKVSLLVLSLSICADASAQVTTLATFPNSMVYAVQTDATGNIYVAFQGNFNKANPFVAKLSPTGQTLYSTTLAGSNFGIARAIAVDYSGAVYAFGNTKCLPMQARAGTRYRLRPAGYRCGIPI